MDYLFGLLTIVISILIIHILSEAYLNVNKTRKIKLDSKLNVLKVMTKDQCYQVFQLDIKHFTQWITTFLTFKGYKDVRFITLYDSGITEYVATNPFGQNTYIVSNLKEIDNWDNPIGISFVKQMVGSLVERQCKYGLLITMSNLQSDAEKYINFMSNLGYQITVINCEIIMTDLSRIRAKELKTLLPVK